MLALKLCALGDIIDRQENLFYTPFTRQPENPWAI